MKPSFILKHFRVIWKSSLFRPCPTVTKHEFRAETVAKLRRCIMNDLRRPCSGMDTLNITAQIGHNYEV